MINNIISELKEKYYKPLKINDKYFEYTLNNQQQYYTTKTSMNYDYEYDNNFENLYQTTLRNNINHRNESNLPSIHINNYIKQEVKRRILFTDINYPLKLKYPKPNPLSLSSNLISLKKHKKYIIEYLDNEDIMMNYLKKEDYIIFTKQFKYETDKEKAINIINNLKKKIINNDNKKEFIKTFVFNLNNFSKIILNIHPLKIKILNPQTKEKIILTLPLNIIPFFYSVSYDIFILFISKLLVIDNLKINEFNLDTDSIKLYIKEICSNLNLFDKNSNLFYYKSQKKHCFPLYLIDSEFELNIIPPILEIKRENLKFSKIIDKGLLIHLFMNDFENWNVLSLCYLSSFKIFRKYCNKLFSCSLKNQKPQTYKIDKLLLKYSNHFLTEKEKYNIKDNNFKFLIKLFIKKSYKIVFINFYSYIIEIIYKNKNNIFNISFEQMNKLVELKEFFNIQDIINKCILINDKYSDDINFSFDLIKNLKFKDITNDFFYPLEEEKNSDLIKINVLNPRFEWKDIMLSNSSSNVKILETFNYVIGDKLLIKLINNPFLKWSKIFFEYSDDIQNQINKKYNRRSLLFKTMKTIVFNGKKKSGNIEEDINIFTNKNIKKPLKIKKHLTIKLLKNNVK